MTGITTNGNRITAIKSKNTVINGKAFLFTPAFPIIAKIFNNATDKKWIENLNRVRYLSNMCLVLRLKHSLSKTYWLNVNDPGFPFVGIIEHTNFDSPKNYSNSHIVYLSRYLATEDPIWSFSDEEYFKFCFQHLKRMFPNIHKKWVIDYSIWRSEFAQPITERNYSQYVSPHGTPFVNAWISTMAQIYPEDRGTNYAIREGRFIAKHIMKQLGYKS